MYSRINYTVVGLFVLLFSAGVVFFGFWLARYGFEKSYDRYVTYFHESISGLSVDSSVKLNGVEVGRVESIEIVPENPRLVRVSLKLESGTPITRDMRTILKPEGVTGLSFVDIVGGGKKSSKLKPEKGKVAVIPSKKSLIGGLSENVPMILDSINSAIERFKKIVSEKNISNLDKIMENIGKASSKIIDVEDRIIELSDEFGGSVKNLIKKTEPILKNIGKASENASRLARDIDKRVRSGEFDIKSALRPLKIDLQELSYRYQELAEEIKRLTRHPSSMIFGGSRPPKGPGE